MRLVPLLLLPIVLLIAPSVERGLQAAEPKHVVIVESMTLPVVQGTSSWVQRELGERGFRPDQEVVYSVLNAEGKTERAAELLASVRSEQEADLVVSVATLASRAARQALAESAVPQLFVIVADPVGEGFTSGIGEASGSNIAGVTHVLGADTILTQVNGVLERPGGPAFRMAFLHSTYPAALANREELMAAAPAYADIEFVPLQFDYRPGADGMAAMLDDATALIQADSQGFEGIWIGRGPAAHDQSFLQGITERSGLPIIVAQDVKAVSAGALLALISNEETNGRAVGQMAAEILRGTDPASRPVERPKKFVAAINISTALKMGIALPSDLIELAGANIYR